MCIYSISEANNLGPGCSGRFGGRDNREREVPMGSREGGFLGRQGQGLPAGSSPGGRVAERPAACSVLLFPAPRADRCLWGQEGEKEAGQAAPDGKRFLWCFPKGGSGEVWEWRNRAGGAGGANSKPLHNAALSGVSRAGRGGSREGQEGGSPCEDFAQGNHLSRCPLKSSTAACTAWRHDRTGWEKEEAEPSNPGA